jgi:SAM-dependent methyltransferase
MSSMPTPAACEASPVEAAVAPSGYKGPMSIQVQQMFAGIAGRYDAANEVLSFGVHRLWRAEAVRQSGAGPGDRVLDCATGTGDLAFAFRKAVGGAGAVVGTDFCAPMLEIARRKSQQRAAFVEFKEADALALPFERGRPLRRPLSRLQPHRDADHRQAAHRPGGGVPVPAPDGSGLSSRRALPCVDGRIGRLLLAAGHAADVRRGLRLCGHRRRLAHRAEPPDRKGGLRR